MITILHGENIAASRKALDDFKERGSEIVLLDGKNLTSTDLIQAAFSTSLLADKKIIIIENYFSANKQATKAIPNLSGITTDIIFWEEKTLTPAVLKAVKEARVREFKLATTIFKLTDSLYPGNLKQILTLYGECLQKDEAEMIFLMIVRQFRLMLHPVGLAPWQESKIKKQSLLLGKEKLAFLYRKLLDLDYLNKTSQLTGSFADNMQHFLLWI